MATNTWDWESVPDGGGATQANTGISPNNPSPGAGGSIVGTANAVVGNRALSFNNGTSAPCLIQIPGIPNVQQSLTIVFKMPNKPPTVNHRIYAYYTSGTQRAYVVLTPAGLLRIGGQGGSGETSLASGADMTAYIGTWCRVELEIDGGTTTTDGKLNGRFYTTPFTTTALGAQATLGAHNIGSGVITPVNHHIGVTTTQEVAIPTVIDYVKITDGAFTPQGPAPTAAAPTVSAGAAQYVQVGSTISVSATESGTFTSAMWSTTELPDGASTPAFANPAAASTTVPVLSAGRYTFRRRLSWSGGTVDSFLSVWVRPVPGTDVSVYGEFDGSTAYNVDGAANSRKAALNDSSTATGIASLDDPANQEKKFILNPVGLGAVNVLTEGYSRTAALTRTTTLYLENGTTVVDSWVHTTGVGAGSIREDDDVVDGTGLAMITGANDAATYVLRRALVVGFKATV